MKEHHEFWQKLVGPELVDEGELGKETGTFHVVQITKELAVCQAKEVGFYLSVSVYKIKGAT